MRSAAYGLFMSLLLLVPIAAVPLMAIFGVPQFTTTVTSPLDELEDEDDWNPPVRKKSKTLAEERDREDDFELSAEEAWNWDDSPAERRGPAKKSRPSARDSFDVAAAKSTSPKLTNRAQKSKSSRASGKKRLLPIPAEVFAEEPELLNVGYDANEEERPFVQTAADTEEVDDLEPKPSDPPEEIPSYRRPRTSTKDQLESPAEKSPGKIKRAAVATDPLTWKKAVDRLNELGIRNFRLEPGVRPGEFTFTCSYTPSQTPHVTRKFEAEADDPLKAVGQVLAQVEKWSQQREVERPRRDGE